MKKIINNENDFKELVERKNVSELLRHGFAWWDEDQKQLLIPGKYYFYIPDGHPILNLNNQPELFEKGVSDNDTRFGCLPYGIAI